MKIVSQSTVNPIIPKRTKERQLRMGMMEMRINTTNEEVWFSGEKRNSVMTHENMNTRESVLQQRKEKECCDAGKNI